MPPAGRGNTPTRLIYKALRSEPKKCKNPDGDDCIFWVVVHPEIDLLFVSLFRWVFAFASGDYGAIVGKPPLPQYHVSFGGTQVETQRCMSQTKKQYPASIKRYPVLVTPNYPQRLIVFWPNLERSISMKMGLHFQSVSQTAGFFPSHNFWSVGMLFLLPTALSFPDISWRTIWFNWLSCWWFRDLAKHN